MIQDVLNDKKKIGIVVILAIVLIAFGILYLKSGFKELKKNDTENIFVDEKEGAGVSNIDGKNNVNGNIKETTVPIKDKDIVVEIKGEVKKPDVYTLNENAIIKELIEAAGGLTENADLKDVNRAKKLQNHELVYIKNKNDIDKNGKDINLESNINSSEKISNNVVNINGATLEELKTLNGIGDSKAKSIIEYREKNDGFKSIEDIKNVTGIGDKMFEEIKEQIET